MSDFNIDYVAQLARLALTQEEKERYARELEKILGFVSQLNECAVDKTDAMSHVFDVENVFRKDEVKTTTVHEDVLKHAPVREKDYFKVPKIIEGGQ
jgi:aspartyl-tRNA(Asn)/glutamyl-tRNA(Gln) amidotransferase subunit C